MDGIRAILFSGTLGCAAINIIFFIDRLTRMGFFEALGRSVFAFIIGMALLLTSVALGVGVAEIWRRR